MEIGTLKVSLQFDSETEIIFHLSKMLKEATDNNRHEFALQIIDRILRAKGY